MSFASGELTRGLRWAWRRARISSCDAGRYVHMESAEMSIELCEVAAIVSARRGWESVWGLGVCFGGLGGWILDVLEG